MMPQTCLTSKSNFVNFKKGISIRFILCFTCVTIIILFSWIHSIIIFNNPFKNNDLEELAYYDTVNLSDNLKYILLWTRRDYAPFSYYKRGQKSFLAMNCSYTNCYITSNENLFHGDVSKFDAIAFNGRNMGANFFSTTLNIPVGRSSHQKYIYFNLESADNYPMCNSDFDNFFNWTATYRLDSDIPSPYIQIKNRKGEIIGPRKKMEWPEINDKDVEKYDYRQNKSKAVAWFVSNCKSRNGRKLYADKLEIALKKYGWTVDIYGKCGSYKCPRNVTSKCAMILERDYFFYLSFENSNAKDYVTEKLLTAAQNNVVPIVFGGADYTRFLPPGSYLDARSMIPEDLARRINEVIKSPTLYNRYFKWKSFYTYRDPSTDSLCTLCAALNNDTLFSTYSTYKDLRSWWYPDYRQRC